MYLPELDVGGVVEEGGAVDGVLRVEDVRHGRVVHDDRLLDLPVQQRQVLHVVTWRREAGGRYTSIYLQQKAEVRVHRLPS